MGHGRLTSDDWHSYSSTHITGRATHEIYTSSRMASEFDPRNITTRESCDSTDNPESTAIIVGLDVTGSMAPVLNAVAQKLGTLVTQIYERRPVSDPHLMFLGIGDIECDSYPLQATQFEADIRIAQQLTKIHFEQGGGGNNYESYLLAWYFAALHTKLDCFDKRSKKGFIFTLGDEEPTPYLKQRHLSKVFSRVEDKDYTQKELLEMASEKFEIFHLIIEEGNHCRTHRGAVIEAWTNLLGQRARPVSDHTKVAEIIISILQKEAGTSDSDILKTWDSETGSVVSKALNYTTSASDVSIS